MANIGSLSYVTPPASAAIIGFALIVIVMRWAPASPARRLFIVMVGSLAVWGIAIFGMRMSADLANALVWDQWSAVAILMMFLGFYHFSLTYTNTSGQRRALAVGYALIAMFAMGTPFGVLVEGLRVEDYGYAPVAGVLAAPAMILALVLLGAGVKTLAQRYRTTSSSEERNRLPYLFAGAFLTLVGTILDIVTNLPPVGIWANILFCGFCAIALLEYRLLDIPHVARRTLTYLILGVMVAVPYVVVLLALQALVGPRLESFWGYAAIAVFLAVFLRPLYGAAQDVVDRLFFGSRYDALRALEQLGLASQTSVELEDLSARLTSLVSKALHATSTSLFLPSAGSTEYRLAQWEGLSQPPQHALLSARGPLIRWLSEHVDIVHYRQLDIEPQLQSLAKKEREVLQEMGATLFVPIASRAGHLAGLLVLGDKRTRGTYSLQDQRLLAALSGQVAISLENARLYSDAVRARRDLEAWLDSMNDSVVIIGEDQTVRFVNRAARENLSVRIGDLCSAALGSDERHAPCVFPEDWGGQDGGMRLSRHIGRRDYEVVAAPLRDPDGQLALIAVFRDITERLIFEEELRKSQEQMRELAAHVELVREEERTGIARELHDELGQLLTALKMDITWLATHAGTQDRKAIATKLGSMGVLADTTMHAVQRISSELRPGLLDDLGLVAALEWLTRDFRERCAISCVLDVDEKLDLSGQQATSLFRICQESLTNAARHSGATKVTVTLLTDEGRVVLSIRDNGKGVSAEEVVHAHSFGLIGMRERARAVGGQLEIVGEPGCGTSVEVNLPLN